MPSVRCIVSYAGVPNQKRQRRSFNYPSFNYKPYGAIASLLSLSGCNAAPSQNILGSYFPSG